MSGDLSCQLLTDLERVLDMGERSPRKMNDLLCQPETSQECMSYGKVWDKSEDRYVDMGKFGAEQRDVDLRCAYDDDMRKTMLKEIK